MTEDVNWKPVAIKTEPQLDEHFGNDDFSTGHYQESGCQGPSTKVEENSSQVCGGNDFSSENNFCLASGANTNHDVPNLVQQIKVEYIEDEDASTDQLQDVRWHIPTTEAPVSSEGGANIKLEDEPMEDTFHEGRWHSSMVEAPSEAVERNPASSIDETKVKSEDNSMQDPFRDVGWHVPTVETPARTPEVKAIRSADGIRIKLEDGANQDALYDGEWYVLVPPEENGAFPMEKATVLGEVGTIESDCIQDPRLTVREDVEEKGFEGMSAPVEPSDSVSDVTQSEFFDCSASIKHEEADTYPNSNDTSNQRSLRSRRFKPTTSERCYSSQEGEFRLFKLPREEERVQKQFQEEECVNKRFRLPRNSGRSFYACTVCPKTYIKIKSFHAHLLTHSHETACNHSSCPLAKSTQICMKTYRCMNCEKKFRLKSEFISHLLLPCKGGTSICELCPAKFNSLIDLNKHLVSHFSGKLFPCTKCSALKSEEPCETCAARYRWQATRKPFICKQCNYKIRIQGCDRNRFLSKFEDITFSCGRCSTKYKWSVLAKAPCEEKS